jgi:hypothetical protein
MLSATAVLLAFWLAVVLMCDIDGFKEARRRKAQADADGDSTPDRGPPGAAGNHAHPSGRATTSSNFMTRDGRPEVCDVASSNCRADHP